MLWQIYGDVVRDVKNIEAGGGAAMSERHDIVLRQHEDGPNPPDLLREMVEEIKKLGPTTIKAGGKYVKSKAEQEAVKVQEIKARVFEKIGKLEVERQRLIKERDEADRKAELELQREEHEHERAVHQLELQEFKEKAQALRAVVDCIVRLKEKGIEVDIKLIKAAEKAAMSLLEDKTV